ncbi:type IV toxin-antitoxin system AbiEi family antitoxin domain-containing protein [Gordonia sp. DT219]|uniref:type IV toxin-antitoxin system AbiEi family antitoxin domain-containing protein n=1 Tax=Gordonia sp. DT219 TaxID=3416658 RepID=UPI003CF22443
MDIHELSVRRDGVFTTREALDCGVSESAIARRMASGAWTEVAHGVHLVAGHPRGARAQARIAVLSVHKNAVLGGAAAAWWLGLCSEEPRKHLVFTQTRGRARRSSATAVSRYRELDDEDVVVRDGLRTTAADLTVLEASLVLGLSFMDSALLSGRVTPETLADVHTRYPKRHGAGKASAYLRLIGDGARSEAERLTVRILRAAGISGWVANLPACGYVIDFAFPDRKVAVEIDGFAYHRDAAAFQRDRTKRNALMRNGWHVLNYTWADLVDRPDQVAAEIAAALRSSSARSA